MKSAKSAYDAAPGWRLLRQQVMQALLLTAGEALPKYGADGAFGSETLAALKSFQWKHSLAADGICGPKSWAELLRE